MEFLDIILQPINYWHWLILGIILLITELLTFTIVFLALGCTALACAAYSYLLQPSYGAQIMFFSCLSIVSLILSSWWIKSTQTYSNSLDLSEKAHNFIGKEYTLSKDMLLHAKIKIDGTLWSYKCDHSVSNNDTIKITDTEGNILLIEKITQ